MIRVLIADDDALVRLGLADLVASDPELELAGQVADGLAAVEFVAAHPVDVVLMDVRMPRMDGITALARIRARPQPPRVVVLTTFDLDRFVYDALAAGADGFLLKDTDPADILRAVHLVAAGQAMLAPAAARKVVDLHHRTAPPDADRARRLVDRLTPRERDVLRLLATGESNADVATALGMRESTVKAHVSRILSALGVGNRVQAALLARDAGLGGR
ncbi:response regulator transcription factor [Klenkia sp. PcliD-1-E]|uniref:response regulator n=1 Tax=Klenkia sp. PcliD-1-E TaxID=2954492 RepID=UPI0020978DAD|nr:response regulator transcription factor [Klenkia sp. PcliD-1-E]MCO7221159.1 response regulator transcription factor [Klenkia sp. PcliD-1-E]